MRRRHEKSCCFWRKRQYGHLFCEIFLEDNSDKDYEVVAVGTRETQKFDELGVTYYQVDITKKEEFDKLPKDVYAVVDLAGAMPARMKGYDRNWRKRFENPKNIASVKENDNKFISLDELITVEDIADLMDSKKAKAEDVLKKLLASGVSTDVTRTNLK